MSPLIVIDPVQKDRNAAAALSAEKFEAFKKAAKEFLKKPSKEFFAKKDLKSPLLKEKANNKELIIINASPLSGKTDVVGSKLLKIYDFLTEKLLKHGFKIKKSDWEWNKKHDAVFYFLFDRKPLPKSVEIEGPPLGIKHHADNFKKVHKKTFVRKNRIYALEQRNFTKPVELLKKSAKERFATERCKSVKIKTL